MGDKQMILLANKFLLIDFFGMKLADLMIQGVDSINSILLAALERAFS